MALARPEQSSVPINSPEAAERLLATLSAAMDDLASVLEAETDLIGAGRIRDGIATEPRKGELSAAYILELQRAKANIIALARFAPERLRAFRTRQAEFERVVDRNQTVILTARTVSESLIRGLSEEVERTARPAAYGPRIRMPEHAAAPLVFSGRF